MGYVNRKLKIYEIKTIVEQNDTNDNYVFGVRSSSITIIVPETSVSK